MCYRDSSKLSLKISNYISKYNFLFPRAKGVSGNFKINDSPRNLVEFRKMCSYIPQDFAMLDLLTVQETLKISADLKLPWETPAEHKEKIVSS